MNCKKPPFNNVKVRQAVAYAIPYQKIMDAVMFGLAGPMYGGKPDAAIQPRWPQPHAYNTDIDKAKQLLAEAGYPNGFETTLSFDLGFAVDRRAAVRAGAGEPGADRHQGDDQQGPGANWRDELLKKEMPLIVNFFSGWLDYPRVLLLLVLSRPERRVQHHELQDRTWTR